MRSARLTLLGLALLTTVPATAQTYGNTSYPVCLQVYGRFSNIDCSYASIEQCQPSAAGRSAQCITNPYYANAAQRSRPYRHRAY